MDIIHSHNAQKQSPFACVMDAIQPGKRESHLSTARFLFSSVVEVCELRDGFAFRLAERPNLLQKLGEFIELEKLCCPFFGFTVEVEPEGGAVWLKLTGREGVKPFIQAEIGEFVGSSIRF